MESTTKRHEVINVKPGFDEVWAEEYLKDFCGLGNYLDGELKQVVRAFDIRDNMGMIALHHLEYPVPVVVPEFLNRGFDVVVDYFTGDWWRGDEEATYALDKSQKNREYLSWLGSFSNGILLGLLSERWDELERVCDWVEADLEHESPWTELDNELSVVYKSLAAGLRTAPMPGLEKIESELKRSRSTYPKLLFAAWEAAREGDQSAFSQAFAKSLAHYSKRYAKGRIPIEWLAPHDSVVALAARRLGLKIPVELPPEHAARIITPESLGLK